jgi:hypothetical protein
MSAPNPEIVPIDAAVMDINRLDTPARVLNWSALTILATIVVPLSLEWAFPSFIKSHPEPQTTVDSGSQRRTLNRQERIDLTR